MGSVIKLLIIGALGGVLGGMGMGGGTLTIPILTIFLITSVLIESFVLFCIEKPPNYI